MERIQFIIYIIGILTVLIVAAYVLVQIFVEISANIWDKERANKNKQIVLNFLLEKGNANWSDFHQLCCKEEEKEKEEIKTRNFLYAGYILNKHNENKKILVGDSDKTSIKNCLYQLEKQGLVEEHGDSWDINERFYNLTEKGSLLANQITKRTIFAEELKVNRS
jgi:coproporphyrinogen III oxidase-like Fe-S oxidoreductase